MKRDMDLIRRIVLATQEQPDGVPLMQLDGISEYQYATHVQWLLEAGFVEGQAQAGTGSFACFAMVERLTWSGCDFADAIRNDSLWRRVLDKVIKAGASFTADTLKDALRAEIAKGFSTLI